MTDNASYSKKGAALYEKLPKKSLEKCKTFATVRHRKRKIKGCYSRMTVLAMVFKLWESAEKRRRRIHGFKGIAKVIEGVRFIDGKSDTLKDAA